MDTDMEDQMSRVFVQTQCEHGEIRAHDTDDGPCHVGGTELVVEIAPGLWGTKEAESRVSVDTISQVLATARWHRSVQPSLLPSPPVASWDEKDAAAVVALINGGVD